MFLCFGNLPSLFCCKGNVAVFVQNRYLVEKSSLDGFSFSVKARLFLERLWMRCRSSCVAQFIVQTPSMQSLLNYRYSPKAPIKILPLINEKLFSFKQDLPKSSGGAEKKYDFIYVASGEPHKNHESLLTAWCLLAQENIFPSLCLTLNKNKFGGLVSLIGRLKVQYEIKVENIQANERQQIKALFFKSRALIFPSLFESFGIPLIEAESIDMPILAGECDFVRDLVDPIQTFDPESPISIARAVKRFLAIQASREPRVDAEVFFNSVMVD